MGRRLSVTTRPLDAHRLVVGDIVRLSRRVPTFPVDRVMVLGEVDRLRRRAVPRIGWTALLVKGFALVARDRPALRSWYVPRRWLTPWRRPCWATSPISVASIAVSRPRGPDTPAAVAALDPESLWWARIASPDAMPLPALQAEIARHAEGPEEEMFPRQRQLLLLPTWLRRVVLRANVGSPGGKRPLRLGTFSISMLAGEGCANRHHPSFLTTSLTATPLDDAGRSVVTILADHRILDGVPVARALAALEVALHGPLAAELAALAPRPQHADAGRG